MTMAMKIGRKKGSHDTQKRASKSTSYETFKKWYKQYMGSDIKVMSEEKFNKMYEKERQTRKYLGQSTASMSKQLAAEQAYKTKEVFRERIALFEEYVERDDIPETYREDIVRGLSKYQSATQSKREKEAFKLLTKGGLLYDYIGVIEDEDPGSPKEEEQ